VRLGWVTDLHFNFVTDTQVEQFCEQLAGTAFDALLVGGDTGEAASFVRYLTTLESRLDHPIYFVLGNHDSYRGSIAGSRAAAKQLSDGSRWLRWLPSTGIVALSDRTCLIGHDGWADGRGGDYANSTVMLNDYRLIEELTGLSHEARGARLGTLGDEAALYLGRTCTAALERFERVIVLTHVPPFNEACWHEGQISNDAWLPHFACPTAGRALVRALDDRPACLVSVLCGHTHGAGEADILPNLHVSTGGAVYGAPTLQRVIEVD
jgi:3',5'-cyclic AMP phosphodiesterase CpdA